MKADRQAYHVKRWSVPVFNNTQILYNYHWAKSRTAVEGSTTERFALKGIVHSVNFSCFKPVWLPMNMKKHILSIQWNSMLFSSQRSSKQILVFHTEAVQDCTEAERLIMERIWAGRKNTLLSCSFEKLCVLSQSLCFPREMHSWKTALRYLLQWWKNMSFLVSFSCKKVDFLRETLHSLPKPLCSPRIFACAQKELKRFVSKCFLGEEFVRKSLEEWKKKHCKVI